MIHETAIVSSKAKLGSDVKIGPYAIIEENVEIGDGGNIAGHAILKSGARIGKSVTIESFCIIGGLPQDLGFDTNTETYVAIGDRSVIREGSTINRASTASGSTIIGEDCFLMAVTHLGHDCRVGDRVVIGNNSLLAGHVSVGDDAFLGGDSGIHQFCRIGQGVMFGGDSTATVDVPPYTMLVERNTLFGLNLVGLRRRKHDPEAVKALKRCYREVLGSASGLKSTAKQLLETSVANFHECRSFLEFFLSGDRGFARPRSK